MIYLDNAATTLPKPPEVLQAVQNAISQAGSLGRSGHGAAELASETAYACRELAASMFDTKPENVVFTFNTTHGLNIAIRSLIKRGGNVVISGFEHNAVLRPLHALDARIAVAGRKLFDPADTANSFSQAITDETDAVICTHVSNVFGYILPIEEIAEICKQRNIPLIIDAAQSAGILPLSVQKLQAAFIAMPGHKGLFGPQGTGLLLCDHAAQPILFGGTGSLSKSMEMPDFLPDRLEAGTQNIHGIAGLLEGLRFVQKQSLTTIENHEQELLSTLITLTDPDRVRLFVGPGGTQSGVISMIPRRGECEHFSSALMQAGFAVRSGFHCAPIAHESAGTFNTGTVRVSFSALTDQTDVEMLASFINNMK